MHTLSAGQSDVGKAREQNEDSFVIDEDLGFFAVSDGMGGHAAGEVASALAIETALERVRQHKSELRQIATGTGDVSRLLTIVSKAIEESCKAVYRKATANDGMRGMGCTLTLVVVSGPHAVLGHVGDSRCYLVRDGAVHQLSTDHTMAGELLRAGHLTPEEAKGHRYAHALTRAIGPQEAVQAETLAVNLSPNDRLLLCSDGLSEYIDQPAWLASQMAGDDLNIVVDGLIAHANNAGGHDNITAVVVQAGAPSENNDVALSLAEDVQIQIDAISAVPAFADLPLGHLSRTLGHCKVVSYAAGDTVFASGATWSALAIVLDGAFALGAKPDETRTLRAGDYLGATALLTPRHTVSSLQAVEAGRVLLLDIASFQQLSRDRPWLGVSLLTRIGKQLAVEFERCQRQSSGGGEPPVSSELF